MQIPCEYARMLILGQRARFLIVALCLCLPLAGCGGDDDGMSEADAARCEAIIRELNTLLPQLQSPDDSMDIGAWERVGELTSEGEELGCE